jgi:hypothetical protein
MINYKWLMWGNSLITCCSCGTYSHVKIKLWIIVKIYGINHTFVKNLRKFKSEKK